MSKTIETCASIDTSPEATGTPSLLLAIPLAFYVIMIALGFSLAEMRHLGLVADEQPQVPYTLMMTH